MRVSVVISPALKKYAQITELELEHGDVQAVLAAVGIPQTEVGFVLVNGARGMLKTQLNDSDRLEIYPSIVEG